MKSFLTTALLLFTVSTAFAQQTEDPPPLDPSSEVTHIILNSKDTREILGEKVNLNKIGTNSDVTVQVLKNGQMVVRGSKESVKAFERGFQSLAAKTDLRTSNLKTYHLSYIPAEYVAEVLEQLKIAGVDSIVSIQHNNILIVKGNVSGAKQVELLLEEIDVAEDKNNAAVERRISTRYTSFQNQVAEDKNNAAAEVSTGSTVFLTMTGDLAKKYMSITQDRLPKQLRGTRISLVANVAQVLKDGRYRIQFSSSFKTVADKQRLLTFMAVVDKNNIKSVVTAKGTPVYGSPAAHKNGVLPTRTRKDVPSLRVELSKLESVTIKTWSLLKEIKNNKSVEHRDTRPEMKISSHSLEFIPAKETAAMLKQLNFTNVEANRHSLIHVADESDSKQAKKLLELLATESPEPAKKELDAEATHQIDGNRVFDPAPKKTSTTLMLSDLNLQHDGKEITVMFQVTDTQLIAGTRDGQFPNILLHHSRMKKRPAVSVHVQGELADAFHRFGLVAPDDKFVGRTIIATGKLTINKDFPKDVDQTPIYNLILRDAEKFQIVRQAGGLGGR